MEKKAYEVPSTRTLKVQSRSIICTTPESGNKGATTDTLTETDFVW